VSSEKLYTISQVARKLKVSRQTLYVWIHQGEVETIPVDNGRQVITQSTLDDLLKAVTPVEQRGGKTANYLLYEVVKVKRRRGNVPNAL
jgi:excisionase family DNA binding protein